MSRLSNENEMVDGSNEPGVQEENFAIIGIGTSAGGLEVLKLFFDNVPSDFKDTFVIVQHLSPDYKSLMADLLSKNTSLPIYEVTNELKVKPGSIYLIPPGKNMTLYQNHLRLTDKPTGHVLNLPINIFFDSLANERKEEAIGIVLSGTGSDGSRGLRSIKEAGGLVMVQRPDTAAFDGMPNSAIATGLVDYVLSPEQMPDELVRYLNMPRGFLEESNQLSAEEQVAFTQIMRLLKQQTDLDFSWYKRPTLLRRMRRRLTVNNCDNLVGYLRYMQTNPEEAFVLYREFLIGVTHFFRDQEAWRILETDVLPKMIREKQPNEPLKVWTVGCSSGEEAYTIGILLQEALRRTGRRLEIKIFATDVEKEHLDRGAQGIYPESIVSDVSLPRLQAFFTKRGEQYQVVPELRRTIIFSQHNALSDPPFGRMDLVICRNFMIYLQPEIQKRLIDTLHYALNKEGVLFMGPSESLGDLKPMFDEISQRWRIYQNKEMARSLGHPRQLNDLYQSIGLGHRQQRRRVEIHMSDALNQALLQQLDAACVYVDEAFNILHAIGKYKDYLDLPADVFSTNLLDMAPASLKLALTTAVRKASRLDEQVTITDSWRPKGEELMQRLHLLVAPFSLPVSGGTCYLVLFMPGPLQDLLPQQSIESVDFSKVDRESEEAAILEQALKETQANLQAALEEAQTTNEELQATNEELMAANEELQSTNEELQSVNEELHTVNTEYQLKIDELAALNADIDNLLSSTQIGTIFLDNNMRIRRFTPAIQAQFDLLDSDLGRPLEQLAGKFRPEDLQLMNEHIVMVLNSGQPKEREVQTRDGRYYLKRVYPFINARQEIGGIVLTFVEISNLKQVEERLRYTAQLLQNTEKTVHVGSWEYNLLTGETYWSDEMFRIYGFEPHAFVPSAENSQKFFHPDDLQHIISTITAAIEKEQTYQLEARIIRSDGTIRHIFTEGRIVKNAAGQTEKMRGFLRDVTSRKQAEEVQARFESIFNATDDLVSFVDEHYTYRAVNDQYIRYWQLDREAVIGKSVAELIGQEAFETILQPRLDRCLNGESIRFQEWFDFPGMGRRYVDASYNPIYQTDDTVAGVAVTARDITILKEQEDLLTQTLTQLKNSNAELEQFAYAASHDLQEPLNTIANFIGLLRSDYSDNFDEEASEYMGMIQDGALRMKGLIAALLRYSRLRSTQLKYSRIKCENLVADLKSDLQDVIRRTETQIEYDHCEEMIGDEELLRQLLQNLLINAIKFRREGVPPIIHVSVESAPDHWLVTVKDNGIGIEEKYYDEIFGIFRRLHSRDEFEGTGLGLALCKQIVNLHGGAIWLSSKPGVGTSFFFTLPKRELTDEKV